MGAGTAEISGDGRKARAISDHTDEETRRVCSVVQRLWKHTRYTHRIVLKDNTPVSAPYRRIPPNQLKEVRQHIDDLLRKGLIVESTSSFASPVVIIRKKDGRIRLCCDYRALNAKTVRDVHPLPRIEECLDALRGARYFTSLGLQSAYNRIPTEKKDQHKTAFCTPFGLFEWTKMNFGLTNAPATFQLLMSGIFRNELFQILLCYLDDILVFGETIQRSLERLDLVLTKLPAGTDA